VSWLERLGILFILSVILAGPLLLGCASKVECDSYCCQSEITCTHEEDCNEQG